MNSPLSTQIYCPPGYLDKEDSQGNVILGDWRTSGNNGLESVGHVGSNRYSKSAAEMRDELMNYFMSSQGSVPWQLNHIHST